MEWWLMVIRVLALTGMLTATGVTILYMWKLRPLHRPKTLASVLIISAFGSLLLLQNLLFRLINLDEMWIALGANAYFLILAGVLLRTSVGLYTTENARRVTAQVEREILDRLS